MGKGLLFYAKHTSWIFSIVLFFVLFLSSNHYLKKKQDRWEKDVRINMTDVLIGKKSQLEKALYSRIYYTKGIAAYVSYHPTISNEEYYELAKEFVGTDSLINSMALSKNCIINAIYPLEGHKDALGLDLLDHPERKEIVKKTIETQKTFVAGPVELVEGGFAFISYTPIFDKTMTEESFWGMTDIVIKRDAYFKSSELLPLEHGLKFALRGVDGSGRTGAVFFGQKEVFESDPVVMDIELPDGNWEIGAIPETGWNTFVNKDDALRSSLYAVSFLLSILIWLLIRTELKIRRNAREQNAVLNSLDNLIIEYNEKGEYLKIASISRDLLIDKPEQLIGRTVFDVFPPKEATLIHTAILTCLEKKELVVQDYCVEIDGNMRWFHGRFSYMSITHVICSAYDITQNKVYQEELRTSNEMKNKLFSIIAHDLRTPVGTNHALVEEMLESYDNYSDDEKKEMLKAILKSGGNTFILLENLLSWSKAQRGQLIINKEELQFEKLSNEVLGVLQESAKTKEINFKFNFESNTRVVGDARMCLTVIRNIISNAIKFTEAGGIVELGTRQMAAYGTVFYVKDDGMGMTQEQMTSLFAFGKTKSLPGTNKESGSGIGLALSKEMVDLQKGQLWVESEIDKGSTFYFSLPQS